MTTAIAFFLLLVAILGLVVGGGILARQTKKLVAAETERDSLRLAVSAARGCLLSVETSQIPGFSDAATRTLSEMDRFTKGDTK